MNHLYQGKGSFYNENSIQQETTVQSRTCGGGAQAAGRTPGGAFSRERTQAVARGQTDKAMESMRHIVWRQVPASNGKGRVSRGAVSQSDEMSERIPSDGR